MGKSKKQAYNPNTNASIKCVAIGDGTVGSKKLRNLYCTYS